MDPKAISDAIGQATAGVLRTCDADGLVRLGVIPAIAAKLHPVPDGWCAYEWYSEKCFIQGGINDADWLNLALQHIPVDMPEDDALKLIMTVSGGRQNPSAVREGIKRSRARAVMGEHIFVLKDGSVAVAMEITPGPCAATNDDYEAQSIAEQIHTMGEQFQYDLNLRRMKDEGN